MASASRFTAILRSLHWFRGLRAGFAVATAMLVCRMLHQPMGWAALGGFEAVIVDNGGPYRSRLYTIASVLFGGAICCAIGILAPHNIVIATLVTALVCFGITYSRVIAQPIASSSVVILVLYFAGFGVEDRTVAYALASTVSYVLGGMWAAAISLFLWPVDPFRPARMEVADCFDLLAQFTASIPVASSDHAAHDDDHAHAVDFKRQLRRKLESAHAALKSTAARAPSRTIRARNLSVLLETADALFPITIRLTELSESEPATSQTAPHAVLRGIVDWLSGAERAIAANLRHRPTDEAASFAPRGSFRLEYVIRPAQQLNAAEPADSLHAYLLVGQRDALQNIEIAFDALRAVWTGADPHPGSRNSPQAEEAADAAAAPRTTPDWLDAIRQNWTLNSMMMRHALRMAVVGAFDVIFIRAFHISHGYWLGMTSIIVLQPYGFGTVRRSYHRTIGTIGGGIFAAVLAVAVHSPIGMIVVITVCAVLTLATYAVHYGWYSFFLTPTFVLLSLPYLRDWRFAAVRVFTTFLGALAGVAAMRLLWPESLSVQLARLLSRCACAASAYTRAVERFWHTAPEQRRTAERKVLAPARRACGLTSQDVEEALDRVLMEPDLPALAPGFAPASQTENALTFTTYIRRFVACLTTLAAVGTPDTRTVSRLDRITYRLDRIGADLARESNTSPCSTPAATPPEAEPGRPILLNPNSLAEQMLQRMERQLQVLERTTAAIVTPATPAGTATELQATS